MFVVDGAVSHRVVFFGRYIDSAKQSCTYRPIIMEQVTFTANRFKKTPIAAPDVDILKHEDVNQSKRQPIQHSPDIKTGFSHAYLLDSLHYSLSNEFQTLPDLKDGETILSARVATDSIALIITTSRILAYNYKSMKKRPYVFEFDYTPNVYNIAPICSLIPNPLNPSKPDLVILDPISGALDFFESIKLAPSLSVLQNHVTSKISLYNAEFLTDVQLFQDNSLLITTSQKRVIYATFKDQVGVISIKSAPIYNNRPLISFMLSKAYSVKEYSTSSHIVAVKSFDISPISKLLAVLESTGRVTFINHLKGSSTFITKSAFELGILLADTNLKFLDIQFIANKNLGIFLVLDTTTNTLSNVFLDFNDEKNDPKLICKSNIPLVSQENPVFSPKMFLLESDNTLLIQNNNKLVVFALNLEQLSHPWAEVILLNNTLQIYSIVKFETERDVIHLATNKGVLIFTLKSSGKSSDIVAYLKDHLVQYLKFSTSVSPVIFDLKKTLLTITQTDLKLVINEILDDLLIDRSDAIPTTLSIEANLLNRVAITKKLVIYVSVNYDIANDEELKIKILNTCEVLSLTAKFYELVIDRDLIDTISEILHNDMKYSLSVNEYFQKNSNEILNLISKYLEIAKNVGNEVQLKNLASLLSTLFIEAFIRLDDNIKQYLNGVGLSTVFINQFHLIHNINHITRMVYNLKLPHEEMVEKYGEILIGLSCFLYYTTNELIIYMQSHNPNHAFDNQLKEFQQLLNSDKDKWIHSFIVLQKQNDVIPLVNKYNDYDSLSALLESKRATLQSLYNNEMISDIEFTNESTDIELEFDAYFDQYGYTFAQSLFNYYIQSQKIDVLLTCFEKHSEFLDKFLSSDLDHYNFAWIHDIRCQRFDAVSNKMELYLATRDYNPLKNAKFQSSLAKLSTLCSSTKQPIKENYLGKFNSLLSLIALQEYIQAELNAMGFFLKSYDVSELTNNEYLKTNDFTFFTTQVQNIFQKITDGTSLTLTEIIDFISLASFRINNNAKKIIDLDDPSDNVVGDGDGAAYDDDDDKEVDDSKNDYDVMQDDYDETRTSIEEEFVIKTIVKLFHLLDHYSSLNANDIDNIVIPTSINTYESARQIEIWKKLLFRRIMLKKEWQNILEKLIAHFEDENITFEFSKNKLLLTEDDLITIGIKNADLCDDYLKENSLLASSD